jgi:L-lactate dehydrogenase
MNYLSRKIALIGCLGIDPVDVFSLAKNHWLRGLLLVGEGSESLAETTNRMLAHWGPPEHQQVRAAGFEEAAKTAIVILNPFTGPCIAESKLESVRRKTARLEHDISKLRTSGFEGMLLVITDPVEVLTAAALKISGFETNRVIGMGASNFDLPAAKHTSVWCTGMRSDSPFIDQCDPNCTHFESVVAGAAKISGDKIDYSGNRIAGMALCVSRVCQAILNDEHEILPVTTWLNGQYDVTGVPATVPCVLGRNGVERIIELPITSAERFRIRSRASDVRDVIESMKSDGRRSLAASI